jgi:hypothetical protein
LLHRILRINQIKSVNIKVGKQVKYRLYLHFLFTCKVKAMFDLYLLHKNHGVIQFSRQLFIDFYVNYPSDTQLINNCKVKR